MLESLLLGLSIVLSPTNLMYSFAGCLLGTLIGVLPGIGPLSAVAMLLPATFALEPVTALIMLAGIYYGAQYGGSTTAILLNMPGESSSVVTCLDGHALARKGRAGAALSVAALASFFAGTVTTFLIAAAAPTLADVALKFGAPDYFSLIVLGLIAAISLAASSFPKALGMVVIGLFLGLVGTDINSGTARFTFGVTGLYEGLEFVAVAIGLFALVEVAVNLERKVDRSFITTRITGLWPSKDEVMSSILPVVRGTVIGSVMGILPGGGALLSSFTAYALEKKISPRPEEFGTGRIEGVAAPEAANNAGAQSSFIPMLTLGMPSNAIMALMLGALMVHGVKPGPDLLVSNPDIFWGVVASMWIGNLMLLILNLPLIGIWVRLLSVPYGILFPTIVLLSCVGVFATNLRSIDVLTAGVFGLVGYVFRKLGCDTAALVLSFILGPLLEQYFRRSLQLSRGDPWIFLERPVSATLLAIAAVLIVLQLFSSVRGMRQEYLKEEG
jgi:putative tricarboxylic transport membrane protein